MLSCPIEKQSTFRCSRGDLYGTCHVETRVDPHYTVYIEEIDHYNSQGELVHQYHENILFLGPLQSIEYVVAD